jgi:hypothetical protein
MKIAALSVLLAGTALGQVCEHRWDEGFALTKLGGTVQDSAVFDDGTGPAVYVVGTFTKYGSTPLGYIARWDGAAFQPVGDGLSGGSGAYQIEVFDDDGAGPRQAALYIAGSFTHADGVPSASVVRWDGASFESVGAENVLVEALAVHDDGAGSKLYRAARVLGQGSWVEVLNSGTWQVAGTPGSTLSIPLINVLHSWDDGTGPALYVGGRFDLIDGAPATGLAKLAAGEWTGITGLSFQFGSSTGDPSVEDVAGVDLPEAGGRGLVVVGTFTGAGAATVSHIARYQGGVWAGLGNSSATSTFVEVVDVGSGPKLYANLSGVLNRRDPLGWNPIGGQAGVQCLVREPATNRLLAFGGFTRIGSVEAAGVATYDGTGWTGLGEFGDGLNRSVRALISADLGSGARLIAGGPFDGPGAAKYVAQWNGQTWTAMDGGLTSSLQPSCFEVHDAGSGPKLYAGMSSAGVWVFDGANWSRVGQLSGSCYDLVSFDVDGPGPEPASLIACGNLSVPGGGYTVMRLAGTAWSRLADAPTSFGSNAVGYSLATFDEDGSGPLPPALYVGGQKLNAQGCVVMKLAGAAWQPQFNGGGTFDQAASAFATFDDGTGPALFAAGNFDSGRVAIYRRESTGWSRAHQNAGPFTSSLNGRIQSLVTIQDQDGPGLAFFTYLGGNGSQVLRNGVLGSWNVGFPNLTSSPQLVMHDDGSGPGVFAGGSFHQVSVGEETTFASNIARLRLCPRITSCSADFNQDGDFGTDQDIEAFFGCLGGWSRTSMGMGTLGRIRISRRFSGCWRAGLAERLRGVVRGGGCEEMPLRGHGPPSRSGFLCNNEA